MPHLLIPPCSHHCVFRTDSQGVVLYQLAVHSARICGRIVWHHWVNICTDLNSNEFIYRIVIKCCKLGTKKIRQILQHCRLGVLLTVLYQIRYFLGFDGGLPSKHDQYMHPIRHRGIWKLANWTWTHHSFDQQLLFTRQVSQHHERTCNVCRGLRALDQNVDHLMGRAHLCRANGPGKQKTHIFSVDRGMDLDTHPTVDLLCICCWRLRYQTSQRCSPSSTSRPANQGF